jgi:hypothetical protein
MKPKHDGPPMTLNAPAGRLANTHFLKHLFGPRCPCVPDVSNEPLMPLIDLARSRPVR